MHKRRRQRISILMSVSGMHGNGNRAFLVITSQQFALKAVRRYAPVRIGQIPILLQFIAQTPHHHTGMIPVTTNEFGYVILPKVYPIASSTCKLGQPFVIQFVYDQYAIFVTQIHKRSAVRIMRGPDMVHTKLLKMRLQGRIRLSARAPEESFRLKPPQTTAEATC